MVKETQLDKLTTEEGKEKNW